MKFLIDLSPKRYERKRSMHPSLVGGQLLTPLTRYSNASDVFAIDNGAYSGFDRQGFQGLLKREEPNKSKCLFVVVPDVVGNARRTLEIWRHRSSIVADWPLAYVAQDGSEDLDIPWGELSAIFIGGRDPWKDSQAAVDICKTGKTLGKHVHIGRVNTPKRFKFFAELADTCDGSGVAMYDHMLADIERELQPQPTFFDNEEDAA